MISEVIIYSTVASAATAAGFVLMPRLDKAIRAKLGIGAAPEPVEPEVSDLSDHATRAKLNSSLERLGVIGDADIRKGKVYPAVPADRLHPLAVVLENAGAVARRLRNPAACSLYVRDSMNDRFMLLSELDLEHIMDAATVMRRTVEDRQKSRSIYKGMTDDEIRSLVRAGMSFYYKDDGSFPESNAAASGAMDDTPEFLIAREVLLLAFQIKRAEA